MDECVMVMSDAGAIDRDPVKIMSQIAFLDDISFF